jgi:formylglycine-generating enzyme required for sulfatase activity
MRRTMPRLTSPAAFLVAAALICCGCSGPNLASQVAKPPEWNPKDQSKCGVTKSHARPLIVEWPSPDRAALEAQARRGLVAVHYAGCEMEVLRQCQPLDKRRYKYTGITRKRDRVRMRDADELYANIPAYAAKFEGKLQTAGELNVAMTIVGTYEAEPTSVSKDDFDGDCAEATHVVTALTAGAFEFFAGADAEAGASVDVAGAAAGGKSKSQRETLNQDGDDAACEKATSKDSEPPEGCGALLRVEVVPLGPARAGGAKPAATATAASPLKAAAPAPNDGCPAGMALVPGGRFRLGSRDVTLGDYCMDLTEVTAEAYGECVKSGKCSSEGLGCKSGANWGSASRANHPMNCVNWDQARTYCDVQDKRLQDESEWEWAARGGNQGFDHPWGNDSPAGQLCWGGAGKSSTCAVGSNPKSDTPQGIHDLIGNVWEWTSTTHEGKGGLKVIRGGSFEDTKPEFFSSSKRIPNRPDDRNPNLGFRCVKTP